MEVRIGRVGDEAVQVIRHSAHIFGDRPLIVIENNDEPLGGRGNIVQGFKTHAASEGCIACNADDMLVGAYLVARGGHSQRGGEGRSRMARTIAVVLALAAQKKAVKSLVLTDRRKAVEPPGQKFVDIALVADIENEPVLGRIEDAVQGNRQFDDPEVGTQMTACLR